MKFFLYFLLVSLNILVHANAATLIVTIKNTEGEPLEYAVATLESDVLPASQSDSHVIDQKDREFVPYVTAIQKGQSINFPNNDNIRHQVYSFSDAKQFEIALYQGNPERPVIFEESGVVALGCNIHDWMKAYVYVTESPFFSVSDNSGQSTLQNLRDGHYRLKVWHPTLKGDHVEQDINITSNQQQEITVTIEEKPVLKAWRAPAGRQQSRY